MDRDHGGSDEGLGNVSSSSDDSNINDLRHLIYDQDRRCASPIIGVSTLMPSRLLPSITESMADDEASNVSTNTSPGGLRLRSNHGATRNVSGENGIPMNDLSSDVGYQQPSAMSVSTTMFTDSRPERSRKVISNSKFDFRQKNRQSFANFRNAGTYPESKGDEGWKVNQGFDDPAVDEELRKVKKTKEGFFHDVKSKIQKTTKNNKLNKIYSPLLIVNLTEAVRSGDLKDLRNLLDENISFNVNKLDKNNLALLHHASINNRDFIARELLSRGADVDVTELDIKATPLHAAARMNSADVAHVLLARCADVNKRTTGGMTPLHISARRGHVEITKILVTLGKADVSAIDNDECTPLHLAATNGSMGVCKLLVEHGAYIRAKDANYYTPLMKAVMNGHIDLINMFLETAKKTCIPVGDYLMDEDNESNTSLHLAVSKRRTEVIQRLLDNGVDVNVRKKNGMTPIHIAAMNGATTTVMQLIENGADIDMKDNEGMTPLHRATVYNRVETMAVLIHEGALVDDIDNNSFTPLLCAAWKGHTPAGELLLTRGAQVFVFDVHNKSPLHWAAEMDHPSFLEFILKHGGYGLLNLTDHYDQTPLHYAAEAGNVDMIKLLLKYEAQGEVRDVLGKSPVHIAAQAGYVACVEELLDHIPMLLNDDDGDGMTPLLTSCFFGRHDLVRQLLKMGADITNVNDEHRTALMLAAVNNHVETMSILIEHNCDIHAIDKDKNNALHVCCDAGHIAAANLLIRAGADQSASNNEGFTPLELAIEREQGEIAAAIIKSKDWRIAMQSKDELMISPMKSLIEKLPDVALLVMDRCVHKTYKNPHCPSYHVKYEYQYIDPGPDDESTKSNGYRYFAIRTMCQYGREKLLGHDLCQSILKRKWVRFGRVFYYLDLFFYVMFLALMTTYTIITQILPEFYQFLILSETDINCPYFNVTAAPFILEYSFLDASTDHFYFIDGTPYLISYMVLAYCLSVIVGELGEIYVVRLKYFTDLSNAIDWVNLVTAMVFVYPPGRQLCYRNWTAGIMSIFFSWMKFILYFKGFKTTGLYVLMFMETLKSLLKAMSVYVMFVVAFAVTFQMCLYQVYRFSTSEQSFLTVITMMLGEFNKDDIFNADQSLAPYGVMVYVLFMTFLFLMPMVINNLTIGIAVGDIEGIQKKAFIKRNSIQADYVYHLEGKFPLWLQRLLYQPDFIVKVTKNRLKYLSWFFPKEDAAFVETDDKSEPRNSEHVLEELQRHKAALSSLKLMMKQQGDILRRMADKDGVQSRLQDFEALDELYDDPPADEDDKNDPTSSVA
ncbi:transient receptor potential cation channel subfamily A member 1-like [Lytechinus pictus]|uniref:transient receptor potential cation channel subfamily A member 1-like n=1 Tax=Lytechinus pictus TaxID=7653 RepID=UPI0030B9F8AA